jgi:two-component system sensor histidine kinase/response regulator
MPKVLIIDDDNYLRLAIKEVLTDQGFDVLEADNGAVGLESAKSFFPDLILCDYLMNNMNGHETLTALRKNPSTAAIPLILMTGSPDLAGMRSTMNLGADDYLTKPFNMDTLLEAVNARCKKQEVIKQQTENKLAGLRQNISLMLPHELNTPLTGILGFAELITSSASTLSANEITEMAQDIFNAGKRLQRLIRNFLIYTQIELIRSDPKEIEARKNDKTNEAHIVIEKAARETADTLQRTKDLTIQCEPGTASISSDLLSKLVEELTINAFKFSESGKPVSVSCHTQGGRFQIIIQDQGRGMTTEQIKDMGAFVQFQRKVYEQQGSGLGLIISHGLTNLYGGQFQIESQPGVGTKVTVALSL